MVAPGTDQAWSTEHGERGGDELNLLRAGENYGWPIVTRSREYRSEAQYGEARSREGFTDPVYEFLPTLAPSGLAMSGKGRTAISTSSTTRRTAGFTGSNRRPEGRAAASGNRAPSRPCAAAGVRRAG